MTPQALIAPARLAGAPLLRAQSDERLVDLVRAGNDAAFEAIVARYRKPLLRYCTRFLGEPRAEDAVQQALVSAYGSLRSSDGEMTLRPWLYRIAHNTALNALRDRALSHEELSEGLDGVARPDQVLESGERFRDVMAAVAALPERQRDAIVLREMEGRSYDEIAAELGVSGGAVRQLLHRGRSSLRAGMAAITPFGLLARVPLGTESGSEAVGARVAELAGAGVGATALSKVAATALVTGAVMGGVAGSPEGGLEDGGARGDRERAAGVAGGGAPGARAAAAADDAVDADEEPAVRGGEQAGEGRRGRGGEREDRDDREENSGPGSADDREDDHSGRGRGGSEDDAKEVDVEPEEDSSGPGPGGSDLSGSGSGESEDSSGRGSGDEVQIEPPEPIEMDSSGSGSGGSGSSGSGSGN